MNRRARNHYDDHLENLPQFLNLREVIDLDASESTLLML